MSWTASLILTIKREYQPRGSSWALEEVKRTGQDRKKVTKGLIFYLFGEKPPLQRSTSRLCSRLCLRRNHVCQVSKWNFRRYDFTEDRIFHFRLIFWMGLTTVQRYCTACDSRLSSWCHRRLLAVTYLLLSWLRTICVLLYSEWRTTPYVGNVLPCQFRSKTFTSFMYTFTKLRTCASLVGTEKLNLAAADFNDRIHQLRNWLNVYARIKKHDVAYCPAEHHKRPIRPVTIDCDLLTFTLDQFVNFVDACLLERRCFEVWRSCAVLLVTYRNTGLQSLELTRKRSHSRSHRPL